MVDEAKTHIQEMTAREFMDRRAAGDELVLVDIREESEWARSRPVGAIHIGKGVLERDVEQRITDMNSSIVLLCGGGYRSALAAASLQAMGYRSVWSLAGGFRAWCASKGKSESG